MSLTLQGACTGQLQCYGHCTWELGHLFSGHYAWEVNWSSMGLCMGASRLEFCGSVHERSVRVLWVCA